MASISINPEYNPGTLFTEITGSEKLKGITSDGRPINIGINQVLNKVEDKIDNVINESLDEKIDQEFGTIINEKIDGIIEDKLGDEVEKNFAGVNSAIEDIIDGTTPVAKANVLNTSTRIGVGEAVSSTPQVYTGKNDIVIPVKTLREAYLAWGGKDLSNSLSPMDCALKEDLSVNKLSFLHPNAITVEYSNDKGVTWLDYNTYIDAGGNKFELLTNDAYNTAKTQFVTSNFSKHFYLGGPKNTSKTSVNDLLRITISAANIVNGSLETYFYIWLRKVLIRKNGASSNIKVKIEAAKIQQIDQNSGEVKDRVDSTTNEVTSGWDTIKNDIAVSGNPGWNSIALDSYFGGSHTTNSRYLRFTFYTTTDGNSGTAIVNLQMYASDEYTNRSTISLSKTGHMYDYDIDGNVTFPANVTSSNITKITDDINTLNTIISQNDSDRPLNKIPDADTIEFKTSDNKVELCFDYLNGTSDSKELIAATAEKAGIMSAQDKKALDEMCLQVNGNKTYMNPDIIKDKCYINKDSKKWMDLTSVAGSWNFATAIYPIEEGVEYLITCNKVRSIGVWFLDTNAPNNSTYGVIADSNIPENAQLTDYSINGMEHPYMAIIYNYGDEPVVKKVSPPSMSHEITTIKESITDITNILTKEEENEILSYDIRNYGLFVKSVVNDVVMAENGEQQIHAGYATTNLIPLDRNNGILINCAGYCYVAFYDEYKNFIERKTSYRNIEGIPASDFPTNAKYVAFSYQPS